MATPAQSPATPTSGGSSKLESLKREDLIKFIKRQTLLYNKAKVKVEEISKDKEQAQKESAEREFEIKQKCEAIENLAKEKSVLVNQKTQLDQQLEELRQQLNESRAAPQPSEGSNAEPVAAAPSFDENVQKRIEDLVFGLASESSKVINQYERRLNGNKNSSHPEQEVIEQTITSEYVEPVTTQQQSSEDPSQLVHQLVSSILLQQPEVDALKLTDQLNKLIHPVNSSLADDSQHVKPLMSESSTETLQVEVTSTESQFEAIKMTTTESQSSVEMKAAESQSETREFSHSEVQSELVDCDFAETQTDVKTVSETESQTLNSSINVTESVSQTFIEIDQCSSQTEHLEQSHSETQTDLELSSRTFEPEIEHIASSSQTYTPALSMSAMQAEDVPSMMNETIDGVCQTDVAERFVQETQTELLQLEEMEIQTEWGRVCEVTVQTDDTEDDSSVRSSAVETSEMGFQTEELGSDQEQLKMENIHLREELTSLSGMRDKLNEEMKILQDELNQSKLERTQIQGRLQQASAESCKNCKALEERCQKFKLLALKTKKENQESTTQLSRLRSEMETLKRSDNTSHILNNYHHLQADYDRLQDQLDTSHDEIKQRDQKIISLQGERDKYVESSTDLERQRDVLTQQLTQQQTQINELEVEINEKHEHIEELYTNTDQLRGELNEAHKECSGLADKLRSQNQVHLDKETKLHNRITDLQESVAQITTELDDIHKDTRKQNVLDLEIADYEKTIKDLESKVGDLESGLSDLNVQIDHLKQQNANLSTQLEQADSVTSSAEDRTEKFKLMVENLKSELRIAKQNEFEQKNKGVSSQAELETLRLENESMKVELTQAVSNNTGAFNQLKQKLQSQARIIQSLESTNTSLKEDLELSRSEVLSAQSQFDQYKVRVHSVLKQQSSKSNLETEIRDLKSEKEHVDSVVESLKNKLTNTAEQLMFAQSENKLLQDELDKQTLRQSKLSEESLEREQNQKRRLELAQSENSELITRHILTMENIKLEHERTIAILNGKLKLMEDEQTSELSKLTNQIARLEEDKEQLYNRIEELQVEATTKYQLSKQLNDSKDEFSENKPPVRECGEGMENPQSTSHIPTSHNPTRSVQRAAPRKLAKTESKDLYDPTSPHGLHNLLQSQDTDLEDRMSITSGSDQNVLEDKISNLTSQLNVNHKNISHLQQLLSDSEASCLRYNDQVTVLKTEIRRLENNQQRENSISNLEYLKNIVYRFLTLDDSSAEKHQLLPVLHTMLKFTDAELAELRAVSLSEGPANQAGQTGWSGYLHRWTGFSS